LEWGTVHIAEIRPIEWINSVLGNDNDNEKNDNSEALPGPSPLPKEATSALDVINWWKSQNFYPLKSH